MITASPPSQRSQLYTLPSSVPIQKSYKHFHKPSNGVGRHFFFRVTQVLEACIQYLQNGLLCDFAKPKQSDVRQVMNPKRIMT